MVETSITTAGPSTETQIQPSGTLIASSEISSPGSTLFNTPSPTNEAVALSKSESNGLGTLAIAGIALGGLLFLCALGLGFYLLWLKRAKRNNSTHGPDDKSGFVSINDQKISFSWQDDPEVQAVHEDAPFISRQTHQSKIYAGVSTKEIDDHDDHERLIGHRSVEATTPLTSTSSSSRISFNQLAPITIPDHQHPQRLSLGDPLLSRRDSVDSASSDGSFSIYSQPSAALSRGPSVASRLARSKSHQVPDSVPPVPSLPSYLKNPAMESNTAMPVNIPVKEVTLVPIPFSTRDESEAIDGLERQSTLVISNLLKTRNKRSQSPESTPASPVSHIERSDSIRPPVGPEEPPAKEPYGRKVRRLRQELSSTLMRETNERESSWEKVPLR